VEPRTILALEPQSSEIRNYKQQIPSKFQGRKHQNVPNGWAAEVLSFRPWSLSFVSNFVLGISNLASFISPGEHTGNASITA
jgi:hypothetical protein